MSAVRELGALLRDGPLELPTLVDEELAALEPLVPPYERIVPLRSLFELGPDEWPRRAGAGEASLLERGLLREVDGGLRASDELRALLMPRAQPLVATIVEATDAGGDIVWEGAFYGLESDAFRLEERLVGAEHRFRLCDPARAATDLARALDPECRAASTPEDAESATEAFRRPEVRARLLAVRRTGPEELRQHEAQIVVARRGVWLVAALIGASTAHVEQTVRPLVPSTLVDVLRRFVLAEA